MEESQSCGAVVCASVLCVLRWEEAIMCFDGRKKVCDGNRLEWKGNSFRALESLSLTKPSSLFDTVRPLKPSNGGLCSLPQPSPSSSSRPSR
ncbi:hypothetical protein RIF29_06037 [Crotalaria pallida]|uniref:Uncharacterized protein n=1 Tax=Crotalaria pallida TaxID=3830 RepID=A0AAN9J5C4_CROPI